MENQMDNGNGSWNYLVVYIFKGYKVEKDPVR